MEEEGAAGAVVERVAGLGLWVEVVVGYCEGHVAFGANSFSKTA